MNTLNKSKSGLLNVLLCVSVIVALSLSALGGRPVLARPSEPPAPAAGALVRPGQTPDGQTPTEWAAIRDSVAAAEYHFAYHDADSTHATPYYWAPNRAQGWQTVFTPQGAQVTAPGGDWTWGLQLTGYGYQDLGGVRNLPDLTANQATLTYRWDANLTEWWVNGPQGLEQGFTLQARPGGAAPGLPLQLDMAVTGNLTPVLRGDALAFVDAAGATVLTYAKLSVTDAAGRVLPARLELPSPSQGEGAGVRVSIDDAHAVYPLTIDPWVQTAKLTASDGAANDIFGYAVAVSGDTVVVGAAGDDGYRGSAYVYVKPGGGWATTSAYTAKLTASDGAANDYFGIAVAVSGDTVVVGAEGDDSSRGSAYVYVKPVGGWATATQTAKLTASDRAADDYFGIAVAVSGDTVVVGAFWDDDRGSNSGSAYVYVKPGGGWATTSAYTAKLTASDGAASDLFGVAVAVSGDTVVMGAYGDDDRGSNSGSAYVYVKPGGGWATTSAYTAKLTASDGAANDYFGIAVAVSGDTVVVGAFWDDSYRGSAYVYVKPGGGWATTSAYTAKLTASDGAANDIFGGSVAVSGDTVVVGADGDDGYRGSAYVYVKPGGGWATTSAYTAKLTASDGAANDRFGYAVAVSGDTVVVGARGDDSSRGSAYVFNVAYTVSYNGNGNDGGNPPSDPSSPYNYGATVTVLGNTGGLVRTGYTFNGWNTAADGSGTSYSAGNTFVIGAADVTLYAQWGHTVTFDANGGSGAMAPQVSGVPAALTLNTFTRAGYTFAGWNTAADGSGTAYADGATYSFAADITLYAQWGHTVTFDANGGSGTMAPQVSSVPAALTLNAFTRAGYTFAGWNTAAGGSGTAYADGATYSFAADITLYAQWGHTVTFDANGGSGAMAPQVSGVPAALTLNTFTRTGYNFMGWNTAANGSGTAYADGATYSFAADITLYAQWSPTGTGPGGVGTTDGSSILELWLMGDAGAFTNITCSTAAANGQDVACWQDQSGNGLAVTQGTSTRLPTYNTSVRNGMPALAYVGQLGGNPNGDVLVGTLAAYSGDQPYTILAAFYPSNNVRENLFAVGNPTLDNNIAYHPNLGSGRHLYHYGDDLNVTPTVDGWQIEAFRYTAVAATTNQFMYTNGNQVGSRTTTGALALPPNPILSIGGYSNRTTGNHEELTGSLSEIIFFSASLPAAQRTLVENYLSAKYNVPLTGPDVYAGDTAGNGDFDLNVAGIGREADGSNTAAHSAGMILVNVGFLQDAGDYMVIGHRTATNGTTSADCPAGVTSRWTREWYLARTDVNSNNGTVDISFDLSESGLGGTPSGSYTLLKRDTAGSGTFYSAATNSSISGDRVTFSGVDASLLGSGFTLGSGTPTAVELARFEAWPDEATIHVQWETAQEIDTLGFNLYRAPTLDGTKDRLNEALISAQAPGSPQGAVYDWIDGEGLLPGQVYYYWLEAVDVYGQGRSFGPVNATAGMLHRTYLPLVIR